MRQSVLAVLLAIVHLLILAGAALVVLRWRAYRQVTRIRRWLWL